MSKSGRKGWQGGRDLAASAVFPYRFCVELFNAWQDLLPLQQPGSPEIEKGCDHHDFASPSLDDGVVFIDLTLTDHEDDPWSRVGVERWHVRFAPSCSFQFAICIYLFCSRHHRLPELLLIQRFSCQWNAGFGMLLCRKQVRSVVRRGNKMPKNNWASQCFTCFHFQAL